MHIVADRTNALLLADKGYDDDAIRKQPAHARVAAGISAKANCRNPAPQDRASIDGATA